jgi:transcriptional regulator with XRE-family HTH domain
MIEKRSYNTYLLMTSEQIRAGRALIKWTAEDLAKHSGVGVATIRRLEGSVGIPSSNARTLEQLRRCLELAGVEFIGSPEAGPGVRLWRKDEDPIRSE